MIRIFYRYPEDDWSYAKTVTEDELFDGSTFDYMSYQVESQEEHDYLKSLELMRGENLHDLLPLEYRTWLRVVHIRVTGL